MTQMDDQQATDAREEAGERKPDRRPDRSRDGRMELWAILTLAVAAAGLAVAFFR